MRKIRALAVLSLAFSLGPAWATCGGGGGGGRGGAAATYQTNWFRSDWDKVLKRAKLAEQGVLIYFQPVGASEHRFFSTKWPNDASKQRLFFKCEGKGDAAKKLRAEFGAPTDKHAVHVCDWFGNPVKSAEKTYKAKFSAGDFKSPLLGMDKLVERLQKKILSAVKRGGQAEMKGKPSAVVKAVGEARLYQGYEGTGEARALWDRAVKAGLAEVEAALAIADDAERKRRLQQLKKAYKGSPVADRCAQELDPKKKGRGKDSQSIGTDETMMMREIHEGFRIEEGLRSGTLPMLGWVDDALRTGLEHEKAGRYLKARKAYARAVSYDPDDSVPLVYIGELDRHHLGRWAEAQRAFERAVVADSNDYAVAIALHGIGKMTIWRGDSEKGLELFAKSIARRPTALCYRNLAVYWNTEGDAVRAFGYATKAFELDPEDSYNQVFYSVYLHMNGQAARARALMAKAEFDPSMSYNYACWYAIQGKRELVLKYLRKHFYEYESCDAVRSFEMAEARMDAFFSPWYEDAEFVELTSLAGRTR